MFYVIAGMLIFIGIHQLPGFTGLRRRGRCGAKRYRMLFSLRALTGLLLIVVGEAQSEFVALWTAPIWAATLHYH